MDQKLPYGLENYGIRFRTQACNGIHLNLAEAGEGPPVFLLHGFPECWASWGPQIKFLVDKGYKVVAPDMRGYGDSDAPEDVAAYDTVELAADVIGLLDAYDQQQGVIIGHDWGCIVAWHTAWLHPERIKGVGGLSVPWFGRGQTDTLSALKRQMGDNYFYIIDFQKAAAHEALNRDTPCPWKKSSPAASTCWAKRPATPACWNASPCRNSAPNICPGTSSTISPAATGATALSRR
ncbi:alpha/beta fold hydrolase [Microbulbifer taiwanensis]|uniref:Alpha/beta fold hydrolase n=1 Tax=Microbulbifer taiwanensis TaxID=986746 RepID=A0ABW1YGX1_9GAMM